MQKKLLVIPFLFIFAVIATACGADPTATPTATPRPQAATATPTPVPLPSGAQAILDGAKAEGVVNFRWITPPESESNALTAAFEKRFGFPVTMEHFSQHPVAASSVLVQEAEAGKISSDVYQGSSPLNRRPVAADATFSVDWVNTLGPLFDDAGKARLRALVESQEQDIARSCLPYHQIAYAFGYNTNRLSASDVPRTWEGLLDPKWKGAVAWQDGGFPLGTLGLTWGEERTVDFARQSKANDILIVSTGGSTAVAQSVASGEALIGIASYDVWLQIMDDGAPVEFLFPTDVIPGFQLNWCALRGPHPNMGKLWVAWGAVEGREGVVAGPPGYKARVDDDGGVLLEAMAASGVSPDIFSTWRDAEGGAVRTKVRLAAVSTWTE